MCGIIHGINFDTKKEPVNDWIIEQYQEQQSRGTEGFGAVMIHDDGTYEVHRATTEPKIMLDLYQNKARHIMFHHRQPTSSDNKLGQTHPILVDSGTLKHKYLLIHNGSVTNDDELKKMHEEELGFVYTTMRNIPPKWENGREEFQFNDSECLAIEVARFIEKQSEEIQAQGNLTFTCLQINKKTDKVINIFFGRNNGYALKFSMSRGKLRLSSEGEGQMMDVEKLYQFDLKKNKLTKHKLKFAEKKVAEVGFAAPYASGYGYQGNTAKKDYKFGDGWRNNHISEVHSNDYHSRGGVKDDDPAETAEELAAQELQDILDPLYESIEGALQEFMEEISNPTYGFMAEKELYIKSIARDIAHMHDQAEKWHAMQLTKADLPAPPPDKQGKLV